MKKRLAEIPTIAHFAILTERTHSVHHAGDERSRTNPGHGYPAYTETFETMVYEAFTSEDQWKQKIGELVKSKAKFRAFSVHPATISTSLSVEVNL
jgi:hypothetical protein